MSAPWFEVDKAGLADILERRGKTFVLLELISNAWDEAGVTRVDVSLQPVPGRPLCRLVVEDDAPEGFHSIGDAWTLFAPSRKRGNAEQRGRFNLGEKLVLALSEEAEIVSTRSAVRFDATGRHRVTARRERGTKVSATIRMTRDEMAQALAAVKMLIPPAGIETRINGETLAAREPLRSFRATLQTEIQGGDEVIRRTERQTEVRIFQPLLGEAPTIYELGVPVVEHDGLWHLDVQQKVPLNLERDNVPPAFLRRLRASALDSGADLIDRDSSADPWVRDALPLASQETVRQVIERRFGKRAAIFDPSDPEANKRAMDKGFTVVRGGSLSRDEWKAVKDAGALRPAGQIFPSGIPTSPDGVPPIPEHDWTPAMHRVARYAREFGEDLLGFEPGVSFHCMPPGSGKAGCSDAWWGSRTITFNLGQLGKLWPDNPNPEDLDALLIHEFAHYFAKDHYSQGFYDACCRLGARARHSSARLMPAPVNERRPEASVSLEVAVR